jgi:DNA-binding Xre family transcriptional regulator
MPKITTKAFQLRLNYEAKMGRSIPQTEIAEKSGVDRLTLRRIERGETKGIDFDTLVKLCSFYGVGVGDILEYDPNIETPSLAASVTW